jgi:hypothetical protein
MAVANKGWEKVLRSKSVRRVARRRDTLKRFLLPLAPVYLKAMLVCPPRREVAFARETRERDAPCP